MRSYSTITGDGGSKVVEQVTEKLDLLNERMGEIRRKIAVVSGKGGVGKSAVTALLAACVAKKGLKVGVMDADLNGSSIPKALGVERADLTRKENGIEPPVGSFGIKVMSLNFFMDSTVAPVGWEGPPETHPWIGAMEASAVRELLADTHWGALDYLFLDTPPSISRLNDLRSLLPGLDGAVIVTIPSEISYRITLKTIAKVKSFGVPIIGLVENMKGYKCVHCGGHNDLFEERGMEEAVEYLVPYLGGIPFSGEIASLLDEKAENNLDPAIVKALDGICDKIIKAVSASKEKV